MNLFPKLVHFSEQYHGARERRRFVFISVVYFQCLRPSMYGVCTVMRLHFLFLFLSKFSVDRAVGAVIVRSFCACAVNTFPSRMCAW